MNIDKISIGKDAPNQVNVIIEVPMNADPVKYEMDKESGAIFVDRFIATPMYYPCNYGFIPHTLSEDGDPADVLVISDFAIVPGAVIAVKPADAAQATTLAVQAGAQTVLSIAAGVSLASLQKAAVDGVAVIRAMPNTPSLVGEGAAGYALGVSCTESSAKFAAEVLGSVGIAVRVQEDQIDAITGLTGSGPAYLFYIAESLMAAASEMGIDAELADPLVRQLLRGAGILLAQSPESAAQLRERVTSPGGTTAAGLASLRSAGVGEAIVEAVRAATARSREMGTEAKK
jgi:pyrroline-5-carboxylate reductase